MQEYLTDDWSTTYPPELSMLLDLTATRCTSLGYLPAAPASSSSQLAVSSSLMQLAVVPPPPSTLQMFPPPEPVTDSPVCPPSAPEASPVLKKETESLPMGRKRTAASTPRASKPVKRGCSKTSSPSSHTSPSSSSATSPGYGPSSTLGQLDALALKIAGVAAQVNCLYRDQRSCLVRIKSTTPEAIKALQATQDSIKDELRALSSSVDVFQQTLPMCPAEIYRCLDLRQQLNLHMAQLSVLVREADYIINSAGVLSDDAPPPCTLSLVITKQPFPAVLIKDRTSEDMVELQVVTGAVIPCHLDSVLEPVVLGMKGKTDGMAEPVREESDREKGIIRLRLKMTAGSRKCPITLKFSASVKTTGRKPEKVSSGETLPFIVITNECQFDESEGILLKKMAFGSGNTCSWANFANQLQLHLARVSRQDPPDTEEVQRWISPRELDYLGEKFFSGAGEEISKGDFDGFWDWFGKVSQKIRYQKHICTMWREGLIWGFTARQEVELSLIGKPPGTFAVRFSERHAGHLAIAYTTDSGTVRHYLLRQDEITPTRSLPDLLAEHTPFKYIQHVTFDQIGSYSASPLPKDEGLGHLYGKKDKPTFDSDYDFNFGIKTLALSD